MELAAIIILSILLGAAVGYGVCEWRMSRWDIAPVPDYDPELYINQKGVKRGEVVDICGVPMTRM